MNDFNTHGGIFAPNGYVKIGTGGSHEENPNGGVQIGVDPNGVPNMVEQDESIYKDFVFSDNITIDADMVQKHNLPKNIAGKLYSDAADILIKESSERTADSISSNGANAMLERLATAQEEQKQIQQQKEMEKELSNLSPEELAGLEAMMSGQAPAEENIGQGITAPDMQAAPSDIEMAPPMQIPVMADGGFLRMFEDGTPGTVVNETLLKYNPNWSLEAFQSSGRDMLPNSTSIGSKVRRSLQYIDNVAKYGEAIKEYKDAVDDVNKYKRYKDADKERLDKAKRSEQSTIDRYINAIEAGNSAEASKEIDKLKGRRLSVQSAERDYKKTSRFVTNKAKANKLGEKAQRLFELSKSLEAAGIANSATDILSGNNIMPYQDTKATEVVQQSEPYKLLSMDELNEYMGQNEKAKGGRINKYVNGTDNLELIGAKKFVPVLLPELPWNNNTEEYRFVESKPSKLFTGLQYASPAIAGISSLFNASQPIEKARISRINPPTVSANVATVNPRYTPVDVNAPINSRLSALAGAVRGASNPNQIIALDYNAGRDMGAIASDVASANNAMYNNVIGAANSNALAKAQLESQVAAQNAGYMYDSQRSNAYNDLMTRRLNDSYVGERNAAVSAPLNSLGVALSKMGERALTMNMINLDPAYMYRLGLDGETIKKKCGGKIKKIK